MSLRCDHIATPLRWSCRPRCRVHGRDVEWIGLKEERYHRMKHYEKYDVLNMLRLGEHQDALDAFDLFRWDEIRTMLAWMKEDLPCTSSLLWFVWNHGVSVEPRNETPQYFLENEARKIHTHGSTGHGSFFSLYPIKKELGPKKFAVIFCWRCAFCMNTFLTIPRTQREELDRYDVRSRDQTREILGAD